MSDDPLRLRQRVPLEYRFAAGRHATRFFTALRDEGRVLATRCDEGHVLVPPRPVCGLCARPSAEWTEVGPRATLRGFTVVYIPFIDPMTGAERPVPYGFGLVRFAGAHTSVYHLIDETDPAALRIGLGLEPVWRPPGERAGTLADIRCFRPVEGPVHEAAARPLDEAPGAPGDLVYAQKIDLPFSYTAGAASRAFLRGLAARRLVASVGPDGRRYVPARSFAPDGARLEETVEAAPRGVLVAATVAHHLPGAPAFGLIEVDGSSTAMLHRLGEGAERLAPGAAVEAVWAEAPEESVLAIRHFRPAA